MSQRTSAARRFTGLVDLAAAELGGQRARRQRRVLRRHGEPAAAGPRRLHRRASTPSAASGWTAGRAAASACPGHDWCVLELGAPGEVVGFDIDTHHFVGNHPPFASVEGLSAPERHAARRAATRATWTELLAAVAAAARRAEPVRARCRGGAGDATCASTSFPTAAWRACASTAASRPTGRGAAPSCDAETRAHVPPELRRPRGGEERRPRAGLLGRVLRPDEQPAPARARRRTWAAAGRRGAGAAPATTGSWSSWARAARRRSIEVDTNHFKGNYPDRCSIEAIDAPAARASPTSIASPTLARRCCPRAKLAARHAPLLRRPSCAPRRPATHVRLNIYPDGGVSRLRVWGRPRWLSRTSVV